jgi:hypothetical protein
VRRAQWIAIAAVVTPAALGVPGAAAATEVGNRCEADASVVAGFEGILFPIATASPGALPVSAPTPGIATQWTAQKQGSDIFLERLKVLHLDSEAKKVAILAESPSEEVSHGQDTFLIRIPVHVGDTFGLSGPSGALACPAAPGDVAGTTSSGGAPGSIEPFYESNGGYRVAVSVRIELDADGDGYGDETQDQCPQSAIYQTACPVVALAAHASARRKSLVLSVTSSLEAPVTVTGQVGWGFKTKRKGRSHASARHHPIVGLDGGTKKVEPGEAAVFRIGFPRLVRRRLHRIGSKESLKARLAVSAPNLAGAESIQRLVVNLKGRKKPRVRR